MLANEKKIDADLADEALAGIHGNDLEKIKKIVGLADINSVFSRDGRPLLMYAIICSNETLVKWLLSRGADPNVQDKTGWSALHFAAQRYLPDVVGLLLDHNAAIDHINQKSLRLRHSHICDDIHF